MKKFIPYFSLFFLCLLVFSLITCTKKTENTDPATRTEEDTTKKEDPKEEGSITGIELDKIFIEIKIGETDTLTVSHSPKDTDIPKYTWESSNEDIFTVTILEGGKGVIKGLAEGTAKLTVSVEDGKYKANATVQVKSIDVTKILLDQTSLFIVQNETQSLKASLSPDNATNKNIKWVSDDPTVATIDQEGKILAVAVGETSVSASSVSNPEVQALCKVIVVNEKVSITSIKLNKQELKMAVNTTEQLVHTILPSNATEKSVTWKSSNTDVAKVDVLGKISSLSTEGETTITVASVENPSISATCKVEVLKNIIPVDRITIIGSATVTLKPGEEKQYAAVVSPANATDPKVTWVSSSSDVASVDEDGKVTAIVGGVTNIRAVAGGYSQTVTVQVLPDIIKNLIASSVTANSLKLVWNKVLGHDVAYSVFQGTAEIASNFKDTFFTVSQLNPYTKYFFQVKACNAVGCSDKSKELEVITGASIPLGFTSSCIGNYTIALKWNKVAEATTYSLYDDQNTLIQDGITDTTFVHRFLLANTTYKYKIKAVVHASASSELSQVLSLTTINQDNIEKILLDGTVPSSLTSYDQASKDIFEFYPDGATINLKYLSPDGAGTKDGSSWANASDNPVAVMDGINDASTNNIYVMLHRPGRYLTTSTINMKNNVAIVGNVDSSCLTLSTTDSSIYDAQLTHTVLKADGVDNTALVYGMKVIKGSEGVGTGSRGAGIDIRSAGASPVVRNVIFEQCQISGTSSSTINGGAIYILDAEEPRIENCIIRNNKNLVGSSAGMLINYSSTASGNPIIRNVSIINNFSHYGGNLVISFNSTNATSIATFINLTVSGNRMSTSSIRSGPGIKIIGTGNNRKKIFILNSTIEDNIGTGSYTGNSQGGGMVVYNATGVVIVNTLFGSNAYSSTTQNAIALIDPADVTLFNSLIVGGVPTGITSGVVIPTDLTSGIITANVGSPSQVQMIHGNIVSTATALGALGNNGGFVPTHSIPVGSSAVNTGLYVKKSGTTLYYSEDNTTWYTTLGASGLADLATLPSDAEDLTAEDATRRARTGRPDIGAYEAR